METKYFLKKNKNMSGPYTLTNLKEKRLKPFELVWHDGLDDWTPAGNIEHLEISATPLSQPGRRITLKKIISRFFAPGK